MPRPSGQEFGVGPAGGIVTGIVCLPCGLLFLLLGAGLVSAAVGGASRSAIGLGVMGVFFVLGGLLVLVNGAFAVIKRHEARIILSDDAVYIGPYYHSVPYREITGVSRGMDDEVMLKRVGRVIGYKLPAFFASEEEVARFIEVVMKRVRNAKRPPATS